MIRIEEIIERAETYVDPEGIDLLRRAYVFSAKAHRDQVRRSGEPYLVHPLAVASILVDMKLDARAVATGLLHDVIEDTLADAETLEQLFGRDVAQMVQGVTKISQISFVSKEAEQADNFRKMLLAMVDDIRVILVKLADRLHNMRTLEFLPEEKRQRIARETLDIYAAIANRLGMGRIKGELQDLAFRHLWPDEYISLTQRIEEKRSVSTGFIDGVRTRLAEAVSAHGIEAEIDGRMKRLYSIWQKMRIQSIRLDEVYDYLAFRIVTGSVKDCYGVLGVVHGIWTPIPGRIKDYIAMPKPNLYQSLHTTLMSDQGHPFEVQIRTHEMHRIAEEGIAAHWNYKEATTPGGDVKMYAWLRSLVELGDELKDPREFLDSLKIDLYPDEVYAFSPRGQVLSFPRGSTSVDFAYAIHTELGHQCSGARINGKLAPLRTELHNGDIVEIMRDKNHRPSRDWLKFVGTTRARNRIRQWLNNESRTRAVELGKSILDKELKRAHLTTRLEDEDLGSFLSNLGLSRLDDLYAAVAYGKVEARKVVNRLAPPVEEEEVAPSEPTGVAGPATATEGITVTGYGDILVSLARCCKPIPGDRIVGYITRGRGVSVHNVECGNVRHLLYDLERRIDVSWSGGDATGFYQVGLNIQTEDRPGMLAKITSKIAGQNTNIKHVEAQTFENKRGSIQLILEIADLTHLEAICRSLNEIDGVLGVNRNSG